MALTQNGTLDRSAFPAALASRARRAGSPELIEKLLQDAEAALLAGGGEVGFLISAGGNGKSGALECRMDAAEMFTLAERALSLYAAMPAGDAGNGAAVSCSYPDFSRLSGGC